MIKIVQLTVFLALGLIFIAVVYFLGQKAIFYGAIDGCLKSAQVTSDRDGKQLTEPDRFWYDFCISEKGIKQL